MIKLQTKFTKLVNIQYPIIQAGMVWTSGWKLASAASNAGALGIIGSGSMDPTTLVHHIQQMKGATDRPYGVNIPLFFKYTESHIQTVIAEKVPIVITSAGNPATYTSLLKRNGITVLQVVSNERQAKKSEQAGVDAVICEGTEAGGHNGREELTSFVLIPLVADAVSIPTIAAGGIIDGRAMAAAFCLGAVGVQVGTRFAASKESSLHPKFKQLIVEAGSDSTVLTIKKITPVRMLKNKFAEEMIAMEASGASKEELESAVGHGRSRKGMFEGDVENGELEIGQGIARIDKILSAKEIVEEMVSNFKRIFPNQETGSRFSPG